MRDSDLVEGYRILLLEDSEMHQKLIGKWLSDVPVRIASTPDEVPGEFDASIAVGILSQSAFGDEEEAIRKYILSRNPYTQLVAILPRSTFVSPFEDNYDACIQRPILEDDFQQTIARRMICGVYSVLLREFYDLNVKLLWIRQAENPEKAEIDVNPNQLKERYQDLSSRLNAIQNQLASEDIKDISKSIERHKRYLTEPGSETSQDSSSKYHPSRCPSCKLQWGVDHGNELGEGLQAIGAGVWKCARCNEIVHGLAESGRRVR